GLGDDLVPWADIEGPQRELQRRCARVDTNGVLDFAVVGELAFERRYVGAKDEVGAAQHARDGLIDLGRDAVVLGGQVNEGDATLILLDRHRATPPYSRVRPACHAWPSTCPLPREHAPRRARRRRP